MRGLILKLQKRHQGEADSKPRKKPYAHYLMWGYYDLLSIDPIYKWQELEPTGASKNSAYDYLNNLEIPPKKQPAPNPNSLLPLFHEEYQYKLIDPPVAENSETGEYRFENGAWFDKESSKPGGENNYFIVVGTLHFTGDAIQAALNQGNGNPHMYLNNLLKKAIAGVAGSLDISGETFSSQICCSTFFTTGFSDMVVLFRTNRVDWVSDILFGLRTQTVGQEHVCLLSTSYMMCGRKIEKVTNRLLKQLEEPGNNMRFSIRILLKPGIAPASFFTALWEDVGKRSETKELSARLLKDFYLELNTLHRDYPAGEPEKTHAQKETLTDGLLFSQMYGNSDILLLPKVPITALLGEYADQDGFLNPKSEFYRKYICFTRTSLRRIQEMKGTPACTDCIIREDYNAVKEKCIVPCLERFHGYLLKRNEALVYCGAVSMEESSRLFQGVRQVFSLYCDIAGAQHSFDIRSMLDPVIESLGRNLQWAGKLLDIKIRKWKGLIKKTSHAGMLRNSDLLKGQEMILNLIKGTDEGIMHFRHEFNELLLDLLRADRKFIESRSMLHSAVGSATKIIFAYSRLLQKVEICLRDESKIEKECSYTFFISCGGTNETKAVHIFPHINPHIIDKNHPKGISEHVLLQFRLPERTLYRVGASIFFLLHELLHFVCDRNRELRAEKIQKSVAAYIVYLIADKLYSITPMREYKLRRALEGTSDIKGSINRVREEKAQLQDAFEKRFTKMIIDEMMHKDNALKGFNVLAKYMGDLVYERFVEILVPRHFLDKDWDDPKNSPFVYDVAKQYYRDMTGDCTPVMESLYGGNLPEIVPSLLSQEQTATRGLSGHLQMHFDSLLSNRYFQPGYGEASHADEHAGKVDGSFPSLYNAVLAILNAFSEAYSDAMAYCFLNCKPWEYLSIFLYENELPIANALSALQPHVVLRIGCVLTVCCNELGECIRISDNRKFAEELNTLTANWENEINKGCLWHGKEMRYEEESLRKESVALFILQIKRILARYRHVYRSHGIAGPLEEYIKKQLAYMNDLIDSKPEAKEDQNNIQSLFHKGLVMSQETDKQGEVWAALLKYWMDSSKPAKG